MKRALPVVLMLVAAGAVAYFLVVGDFFSGNSSPVADQGKDGPVSRVPAIEASRGEPAPAGSLEALMVELTETTLGSFDDLIAKVEGPGACEQLGAAARKVIARARARTVEILETIGQVTAALPPEKAEEESRRAAGRLSDRMQAFGSRQAKGLESLRAFKRRCPEEAARVKRDMDEMMRRIQAADPR